MAKFDYSKEQDRVYHLFSRADRLACVLALLPVIDAEVPAASTARAAQWLHHFGRAWNNEPDRASFDEYAFADALSAPRREALARAIRKWEDEFQSSADALLGYPGRAAVRLLDEPIRSARRRESKLRKQLPLFQGL